MALDSLNGRAISWSEIKVTANVVGGGSFTTVDIKSIDHETKVDRGEQRGASGGRVRKRTTGQGSNSASGTFYKDGLRDFKRQLISVAPQDDQGRFVLSKVTFDIVITHSFEDDTDQDIYVTKLLGCHLDKDGGKHAEGTDAETVDVDLNPIQIVEVIDGKETVLL